MTNVHKHFPESKETQKGHMQNQRQVVRATKVSSQLPTQHSGEAKLRPEEKQRNVFLTVYEPKETLYMEQTEVLPQRSSRGNRYQMILHKMGGNST